MLNIRMPRIIMACLVGCCLASAGACYQGVFQNPMAAPDLLGASTGACFGAALAILHGRSSAMITLYAFQPAYGAAGLCDRSACPGAENC